MGKLEKTARWQRRLGAFQQGMLAAAAIGGVVLVGATMPNAARILKYFPGYKSGARFNYRSKRVLTRLTQDGHIAWYEEGGKKYARLTTKGEFVLQMQMERIKTVQKRRWDRRWRVVAFDISDRRKSARNHLRRLMTELGFARLQDSVWIYPHDCEDLIALLKTELHLGKDVLYMIVQQLEGDENLRRQFSLPLED